MKFHLPLKSHKPKVHKHDRFNPHRFWRILLLSAFIVFIAVFAYFAYFYLQTNQILETPVTPEESENSAAIRSMRRQIDLIQNTIEAE